MASKATRNKSLSGGVSISNLNKCSPSTCHEYFLLQTKNDLRHLWSHFPETYSRKANHFMLLGKQKHFRVVHPFFENKIVSKLVVVVRSTNEKIGICVRIIYIH